MTTAPFDRWRASYRHRPGQLPTREKLDSLAPDEIVGVRVDILLQLVVQAENHEAPCPRMHFVEMGPECRGCDSPVGVDGVWCEACGAEPLAPSSEGWRAW